MSNEMEVAERASRAFERYMVAMPPEVDEPECCQMGYIHIWLVHDDGLEACQRKFSMYLLAVFEILKMWPPPDSRRRDSRRTVQKLVCADHLDHPWVDKHLFKR